MDDCIASVSYSPVALRNILLIAGMHYASSIGHLAAFESTFLFHKVQSIQTVNKWLADSTPGIHTLSCITHIITLAFTESFTPG
ncbi:hypothetical protein POJ06DRAFT_249665 [Lipomyces tetrasporus]|uniref:Uncharacterized protein n=1 Tax=Lipomyces tetrasporus TaxID=54092 RepID=A0AAD7VSX3_9ASCO|nr:uncharacterized protein POJ06DRAFT_249665 [Lipomyces tetrasporus]KAJ8100853.1 hypothetical protein POJ06DRAFT_249665 [Lipomyces tetrasporus]